MSEWIKIEDKIPAPSQPIYAKILYLNKISEVKGCRSKQNEEVILYDFYSGLGCETIIEWKPRTLPNKLDAHPWSGIENRGI